MRRLLQTTTPLLKTTFQEESSDGGDSDFHFCLQQSSYKDKDLPRRLRQMSNVKSFILDSNLYPQPKADWNEIPPELKAALQHLIRLPTLECLEIMEFRNIPASVLSASGISELIIHHTNFSESDPHKLNNTPPSIVTRLKSFDFYTVPLSGIQALIRTKISGNSPAIDFSSLNSLTVDLCDSNELAGFEEVMKASPNLELLDCSVSLPNSLEEVSPSLAANRSLKTLKISLKVGDDLQDPLLGLPEALSMMSGKNGIENLIITVTVQPENSCRTDGVWGRLDDALSRSSFHGLRHVSLTVIIFHDDIAFVGNSDTEISKEELEEVEVFEESDRRKLKEELEKMGATQFSWLSNAYNIQFEFSVEVIPV
jgi:hypothetical protein